MTSDRRATRVLRWAGADAPRWERGHWWDGSTGGADELGGAARWLIASSPIFVALVARLLVHERLLAGVALVTWRQGELQQAA